MEDDQINNSEVQKPLVDEVIYPDIEPGIINRSLIESSYLKHVHRGEGRRLHQLEPVVLEQILTMRLEFNSKYKYCIFLLIRVSNTKMQKILLLFWLYI